MFILIMIGFAPAFLSLEKLFPGVWQSIPIILGNIGYLLIKEYWLEIKRKIFFIINLVILIAACTVPSFFRGQFLELYLNFFTITGLAGYIIIFHKYYNIRKVLINRSSKSKLRAVKILTGILLSLFSVMFLVYFFSQSVEFHYLGEMRLIDGWTLKVDAFGLFMTSLWMVFLSFMIFFDELLNASDFLIFLTYLLLFSICMMGVWVFFPPIYCGIFFFILLLSIFEIPEKVLKIKKKIIWAFVVISLTTFLLSLIDKPTGKKFLSFDTHLHSIEAELLDKVFSPGRIEEVELKLKQTGYMELDENIELHVRFVDSFQNKIKYSETIVVKSDQVSSDGKKVTKITTGIPFWLNHEPGLSIRMYAKNIGYLDYQGAPVIFIPIKINKFDASLDYHLLKSIAELPAHRQANNEDKNNFLSSSSYTAKERFAVPMERLSSKPFWGVGFSENEFNKTSKVNNYIAVLARLGLFGGSFFFIAICFLMRKIFLLSSSELFFKGNLCSHMIIFCLIAGLYYNIPFSHKAAIPFLFLCYGCLNNKRKPV